MYTKHACRWATTVVRGLVLCALPGFAAADAAAAGDTASGATSYERMAPLEQYLMPDPGSEIALARSAAPAAISDKATVLTLDSQGYETAVHGTNGFTCLVERSWMSPFESTDFWNPKMRGPVCYNPAASEVHPRVYTLRRTKLVLAGDSKAQDARRGSRCGRAQRGPLTRAGRDVLHDGEGWVPRAMPTTLAPASDVPRALPLSVRRQLAARRRRDLHEQPSPRGRRQFE
jgi:hypothetical protein